MEKSHGLLQVVFINSEHELRSGWRVLIFGMVFFGTLLIPAVISILLLNRGDSPASTNDSGTLETIVSEFLILTIVQLIACIAATIFCARILEKRTFQSVGFRLHAGCVRDLIVGSLIGGGMVCLSIFPAILTHSYRVSYSQIPLSSLLPGLMVALLAIIMAATFEELLFRGFPFQAIAHNMGPVFAVALTSVLFGLIHLTNIGATLFSSGNTMLAGAWLGIAYLKTRSLWLATGLHYSWNFVMGGIFGLPVSGLTLFTNYSPMVMESVANPWLTGASYGPEGGLLCTISLIFGTLVIAKWGMLKPSQEMLEITRHGSLNEKKDNPPSIVY